VSDRPVPAVLKVAGLLAAGQGAALIGYAVLEGAAVQQGRLAVGLTTAAFFAAYGVGLAWCGVAVIRGHAGARSPIILASIIWLGVAWSFRGGDTTWVALSLAVLSLVVLTCLLHPASTRFLTEE